MTETTTRRGIECKDHGSWHSYTIDGRRATGVTTALKGVPKQEILVPWAAKTVAEHVVDNIYDIKRMIDSGGRNPTIWYLKELPNQVRDTAAVRGTAVHKIAEQIIRHEEVEVPEPLTAYVEGYLRYLEDFNPTTIAEELIVGSREHMVAGRLDSIQDIPAYGRSHVDYKTGKGVYGEAALQVAAYRHMEVCVDAEGNEQPNIQVEHTFVLHLMPGEYELVPVQAGKDEFGQFLAALANYRANVMSRRLDKLIGEPVEPPKRGAA